MKKIGCLVLILASLLSLTGCFSDVYCDSLEDYVDAISHGGFGCSETEIDAADYFLPSQTFLQDYDYVEGNYRYFEEDLLHDMFPHSDSKPETCLLSLQYEESIYAEAKQFTLDQIEAYNNEFYTYGQYCFYENANFVNLKGSRQFPTHFTMVCYNDEECILIFLGFYECYPDTDLKYTDDIKGNWTAFIDAYFGEYYDFSK